MPPDGGETLALWREAGEWWRGDPDREIRRFIDAKGIRRETVTALNQKDEEAPSQVRIRRLRDEKARLAGANVPASVYGSPRRTKDPLVLLHAQSAYSLSRGTMLAGELPALAAEEGYAAALLADRFALTGAHEFCKTARAVGLKPLIGATLELADGGDLVLVAKNQSGYRSLSRLITACHLDEPRLYPLCTWERLEQHAEGLLCLTGGGLGVLDLPLAKRDLTRADQTLQKLVQIYGRENLFVQIERSYLPWQRTVEHLLLELAEKHQILPVAGGPVLFARKSHFPAHDVLVCVDTLCLIEETEGRKPPRDPSQHQITPLPRRSLNAERYLRSAEDHRTLFADRPDLLQNAKTIAKLCEKNVLPLRTDLPAFCENEDAVLRDLVLAGAHTLYPKITSKLRRRIEIELDRLAKLGWSRHFLIAWEMCEWARGEKILLSGRGSVVDSVVAYCLGISRIDAFEFNLHFDRFLPPDGSKRPDIDIDFEAARREDVRQHLVQRYGNDHVATVSAIGTYGSRGIIREVGKVMGIPEESVAFLAKRLHGSVSPEKLDSALNARPELRDSKIPRERYHWVFQLAGVLMDLPRNLRAHSSGVVLSSTPIADTVPVQFSGVEGVNIMQWDKRSAKHYFDKFDVLCLRGNDVLGGTMRRVEKIDVTDLPLDDPEVYRTMRSGQLIGIPQSASPAMRQAHIRIGTKNLKDAGIVQAGIRPGVGGAVKLNEYVARRHGKRFRLIHPDLEPILGPTLGIVVFQEQIDQLLSTFGGFTGDQAEEIREAIQKHARHGTDGSLDESIIGQIVNRGYSRAVAREICTLVSGFKGYGFAEGHALAFAEISIRSIYCQQNFPAPYFSALLDAQPAGYYGPVTIANEARIRGVKMLPPDVNLSDEKFTVEDVRANEDPKILFPGGGIRVPLSQVAGVSAGTIERTLQNRPFTSFFDFAARVGPARDELETLVLVGAFDTLFANRRALLWTVNQAIAYGSSIRGMSGCLPHMVEEPALPRGVVNFSPAEKAVHERRLLGLDVEQHLMAYERDRVRQKGALTAAQASVLDSTEPAFVVGNPIRLRFPPTSSGKRVMFFDLEDETGLLNVTCFDEVYQRDGHKVICCPYITLWGEAQNRDGHIAFLAHRIHAYKPLMESLADPSLLPVLTGDFMMK